MIDSSRRSTVGSDVEMNLNSRLSDAKITAKGRSNTIKNVDKNFSDIFEQKLQESDDAI
jgi:hypothetical protein